jgi:2-polyprenyl-3-methyl-5-hydroxy-6-metoxy-1,4-benzoquinol methylase
VLEVGCGNGRLTWRFADQARSVLAIDPDAAAIAEARAGLPEHPRARVTFQQANVSAATLSTAAFDVVVLSWSL